MSEQGFDGFAGYIPETVDPGLFIVVAVIGFSVASNSLLPCMVSLGVRYEKRKIASQVVVENDLHETIGDPANSQNEMGREESGSSVPSSFVRGRAFSSNHSSTASRGNPRTLRAMVDKVRS